MKTKMLTWCALMVFICASCSRRSGSNLPHVTDFDRGRVDVLRELNSIILRQPVGRKEIRVNFNEEYASRISSAVYWVLPKNQGSDPWICEDSSIDAQARMGDYMRSVIMGVTRDGGVVLLKSNESFLENGIRLNVMRIGEYKKDRVLGEQ